MVRHGTPCLWGKGANADVGEFMDKMRTLKFSQITF
jgi:hypothetical protein